MLISKSFLKVIAVPLALFFIFAILIGLYKFFHLTTAEQIVAHTKKYYDSYGLWVVFVGALAEGLLFVNWYVPGSIVVVFGVIFARPYPTRAALTVFLIILGFFLTSLLNYALGKYGWYRLFLKLGLKEPLEKIKRKVENKGLAIIFSTYLHPNLGALTATSAGMLRLPFKKFFFFGLLATIAWNTLWGAVVYFSGPWILNLLTGYGIGATLLAWIIYLTLKYKKEHKAQ